jgi:acyl carrier protein
MNDVRERVRSYVQKVLKENKDDTEAFSDTDSLVMSGRLSSLDIVDVLTFLEGEFGFEMDPNDFDQAKFDSVDAIVAMLERQTA